MKIYPKSEQEHVEFWLREICIPARQHSEGLRRIQVSDAMAEYEIAPLPDGRWAVRTHMEYAWATSRSVAVPWMAFDTREKCVDVFVDRALAHFDILPRGSFVTQRQFYAHGAMLARLDRGLFGFIEPVPHESSDSRSLCRPY